MRTIRPQEPVTERGYSLVEMLTVVAIIGVLSLFVVPNFMSMYRASKLKTSLRQFTNDLRAARQQAVTRSSLVRVAFVDASRRYYMFESTDEGTSWALLGTNPKYIDETVYFENSSGANELADTIDDGALGDLPDIVFERTGVAQVAGGFGILYMKSNHTDIWRPTYTLKVRTTGVVTVE